MRILVVFRFFSFICIFLWLCQMINYVTVFDTINHSIYLQIVHIQRLSIILNVFCLSNGGLSFICSVCIVILTLVRKEKLNSVATNTSTHTYMSYTTRGMRYTQFALNFSLRSHIFK